MLHIKLKLWKLFQASYKIKYLMKWKSYIENYIFLNNITKHIKSKYQNYKMLMIFFIIELLLKFYYCWYYYWNCNFIVFYFQSFFFFNIWFYKKLTNLYMSKSHLKYLKLTSCNNIELKIKTVISILELKKFLKRSFSLDCEKHIKKFVTWDFSFVIEFPCCISILNRFVTLSKWIYSQIFFQKNAR